MSKKQVQKITFLAIVACFLWSTAFVAVKIGLKYSSPFYFSGIRFMLSGLVLLPFSGNIFTFFKTVGENIKMILTLGFLQTFVLYGIFFHAMTFISGSLVAILIGSSPLITAITSHYAMDDDEMHLRKTLFLAIGIIGVVILSLSRKPWTGHGLKEFAGMLFLLVGSVSSAMGNIIVAKDKKVNPVVLNAAQIFFGGFLLFVLSVVFEGRPVLIRDPDFYIALAWLVFISSTAFSIWFVLLSTPGVKVSELNIWKFVIPLSGAGLSWLILPDESPELLPVTGMIFIVVSIILVNRYSLKRGSS
jgi:drug/metabolite transporter (DMT)-like permease